MTKKKTENKFLFIFLLNCELRSFWMNTTLRFIQTSLWKHFNLLKSAFTHPFLKKLRKRYELVIMHRRLSCCLSFIMIHVMNIIQKIIRITKGSIFMPIQLKKPLAKRSEEHTYELQS